MLKLKKLFSVFVGTAMAANMFATIPISAFAEETVNYTYAYNGYEVSYNVTNSWGNTDAVSITLSNTGDSTIENWMLYFTPNGDVTNVYDALQTDTSTGTTYFRNSGYNADIAPNASVTFAYTVDNCEDAPNSFTLCQARTTKESGYDVQLKVNESWGNSFNGEIVIQNNTNAPIEAWELTIDTNFTITEISNSWAATVTELEPYSYLLKGTYTGTVAANSSVSLGFIGVRNGEPEISNVSLTEVILDEDSIYNEVAIKDNSISDLENLNKDSYYPLEVARKDDGTVYSIDGKFSNILVTDAESALNSLYSVKALLGITDPKSELKLDYVYDSTIADYKSYFFNQVYNGVEVYSRSVTVVARDNGETLSLDSNYVNISNIDTTPTWSIADIETKFDVESIELVIYTLDEFERDPFLAYVCNIDNDNTILVSSESGEVILRWNNVNEDEPDASNGLMIIIEKRETFTDENGNVFHTKSIPYNEKISDPDGAKDAIDKIALGVDFSNPENELVFSALQTNDYKNVYHFNQVYKGINIFGRVVSLAVNTSDDKANALNANVVKISDGFNIVPDFDKPIDNAELVIYTWDDNENNMEPELAYIYDDILNNRTVITFANRILYKPLGKGLDQGMYENIASSGQDANYAPRPMKLQYFPVTYEDDVYKLSTKKLSFDIDADDKYPGKIQVRKFIDDKLAYDPIECSSSYFYEPEAVSSYINAIQVCAWYGVTSGLNHFKYATSSGNGISNSDFVIGVGYFGKINNAGSKTNHVYTTECPGYQYTFDVSLDAIAHEFTHGVFRQFSIPNNSSLTMKGINEGYADLFACFIDENWTVNESVVGNKIESYRNAANAPDIEIDFNSEEITLDEHYYIPFITYPAYLMATKYNISMERLYYLYYASLSQGQYNLASNMNSVRINVIKAAKALNFTDSEMLGIINAFDEIWGNDNSEYKLTIDVQDYDNSELELNDVSISLKNDNGTISFEDNVAQVTDIGWYTVNVKAEGYVSYNYRLHMGYSDSTRVIRLVKDSSDTGTVNIQVVDYINWLPVNESVQLYTLDDNLNQILVGEYKTGVEIGADTGWTGTISLSPGYYLPYVENGYHYFAQPIIIASGGNISTHTYYDLNLNPNEITDVFYFDMNVYEEYAITKDLCIDELVADHYVDSNGNTIAKVGRDITQFGYRFYFYCYEREDEEFSLGFDINSEQAKILANVVRMETGSSGFDGKIYNLEITFTNMQDPNYSQTIVLKPRDLMSEGFHEFATISFDSDLGTYITSSSY